MPSSPFSELFNSGRIQIAWSKYFVHYDTCPAYACGQKKIVFSDAYAVLS